jgi:hypothetical protein
VGVAVDVHEKPPSEIISAILWRDLCKVNNV